jgi:hypothetical protein
MEFPGIRLLPCRPWLVALEEGVDDWQRVIELYEQALGSLKKTFDAEFGGQVAIGEIREPKVVLIFRSRAALENYWRRYFGLSRLPDTVPALYHVTKDRTVTYHDPVMPIDRLLHEGTHQLVHTISTRTPSSFWLHEGLGTYFETYKRVRQNGGFETILCEPRVNLPRWRGVRPAFDDPTLRGRVSLRDLLDMSLSDFQEWYEKGMVDHPDLRDRMTEIYYGAAWSVVYFMLRSENPLYRRVLMRILHEELHGSAEKVSFQKHLEEAGIEFGRFEEDLEAFIRNPH